MFLIRRPSREAIERFIGRSQELPLSYSPIGLLRNETVRHDIDETVAAIGRGRQDFERARIALARWRHFEMDWVELFPRHAPIEPGTVVAVLIRHLGFWSLNGCRIVYCVGDCDRGARFGFAYGTLTNHSEAGEELFEVFMNPDSDEVTYRIRAISRPQATLTRIGYPVARLLQARFQRESADAMRRTTPGNGVRR